MTLYQNHLVVRPEWIDHNNHMNVACFVLAFDSATDAVYSIWGLGEDYSERTGCSVFTLGMDVDYLAEVFEGDRITITTQLLDWDQKRVHYYHRMINADTGQLVAVNECLAMNVQLEEKRSTPFPETVQIELARIFEEHRMLAQPDKAMRRLRIHKALSR